MLALVKSINKFEVSIKSSATGKVKVAMIRVKQ
ncbi:MAG: hypothetical protein IPN22_07270 [Bacteroidetes bacterium]|nr:hypothetical protein [Bacteroidota bacterium]